VSASFVFADTLSVGAVACALTFVVAEWRRVPRSLLVLGPWLLIGATASAIVMSEFTQHFESMLRLIEKSGATAEQTDLVRGGLRRLAVSSVLQELGAIALALAGLQACRRLGLRGLPWTRRLVRERDPAGPGPIRWLGETATLIAGAVAWSCLCIRLSGRAPEQASILASLGSSEFRALTSIVLAPVFEELGLRLGVQGLIARMVRSRWSMAAAVVGSALLWSLLHDSEARLLQFFPVGLALGWLQLRHGTEACIVAHAGFNASMLGLAPILWPA